LIEQDQLAKVVGLLVRHSEATREAARCILGEIAFPGKDEIEVVAGPKARAPGERSVREAGPPRFILLVEVAEQRPVVQVREGVY
jgi:hypothetical protein